MAFILTPTTACAKTSSSNGATDAPRCTTRRKMLQAAVGLATAALIEPVQARNELPQLPNGARQFSQIISAQRQWTSLKDAFADDHVPNEAEWQNIRTYLRGVYSVSGDMEFLTKRWVGSRKEVGLKTIREFRKLVKALDKPAIKQDVEEFLKGHAEIEQLFVTYLEQLKEDTVGDMPDEL